MRGACAEEVTLTELPVDERGPVLRAFLEQVRGVRFLKAQTTDEIIAGGRALPNLSYLKLRARSDGSGSVSVRNLNSTRFECDEIRAFCYAKAKNVPEEHRGDFGYGDVWTWTAIDADSKLIASWLAGSRGEGEAIDFMRDLASRVTGRLQITTDGHPAYPDAIERVFGPSVDYAQRIKQYGTDTADSREISQARKYSPKKVTSQNVRIVIGNRDPALISTSYVERQNLNMRMGVRRFTRLTNGFSKKVENHAAAIALYTMYHNFGRTHEVRANAYPRTPAMAAGIADHVWSCEEIAALLG